MGYIFTTETRLSNKDASGIIEYAKQYAPDFGLIERYVWHYITSHQGIPDKAETEYRYPEQVRCNEADSELGDLRYVRQVPGTEGAEVYRVQPVPAENISAAGQDQ